MADMHEDPIIQNICPDHAPGPLGLTIEKIDPSFLIGKHVKVGFDTGLEEGKGPTKEHIWLRVYKVCSDDPTKLYATVASTPVALEFELEDMTEILLGEIEDIYTEGQA